MSGSFWKSSLLKATGADFLSPAGAAGATGGAGAGPETAGGAGSHDGDEKGVDAEFTEVKESK